MTKPKRKRTNSRRRPPPKTARPADTATPGEGRSTIAKPGEGEILDKVVVLVVTLQSRAAVEAAACEEFGLDPKEAADLITEAYQKVLAAALVNRQAEAGAAVIRLRDIYQRAQSDGDLPVALAAQKELSRLLDLYNYRARPAADEVPATPEPGPLQALKILDAG